MAFTQAVLKDVQIVKGRARLSVYFIDDANADPLLVEYWPGPNDDVSWLTALVQNQFLDLTAAQASFQRFTPGLQFAPAKAP